MVQLQTLKKIAITGAVISIGTGVYLQHILQQRVRNTEVFQEVIIQLLHNKGAVTLLGEPINIGSVDVSNSENYCYSNKAHLKIPIKGSKSNGVLEFWADKSSLDTAWKFNAIELEIKDERGGRLNISTDKYKE